MTARKIEKLADVQPGDMVTVRRMDLGGQHYIITGVARETGSPFPHLTVGPVVFRDSHGGPGGSAVSWSATREVPDLPTTPGSVILDATIRGERARVAFLDDGEGWYTPTPLACGGWNHRPEDITAWTPAKVVPDGDPVTR